MYIYRLDCKSFYIINLQQSDTSGRLVHVHSQSVHQIIVRLNVRKCEAIIHSIDRVRQRLCFRVIGHLDHSVGSIISLSITCRFHLHVTQTAILIREFSGLFLFAPKYLSVPALKSIAWTRLWIPKCCIPVLVPIPSILMCALSAIKSDGNCSIRFRIDRHDLNLNMITMHKHRCKTRVQSTYHLPI